MGVPATLASLLSSYRRLGADPPFGDLRRAHGVTMEGYFWRLTDRDGGRAVIALCGVCRDAEGTWAVVAVATHPGRLLVERIAPVAAASPERLEVSAGDLLHATAERLRVSLGDEVSLDVDLRGGRAWPLRAYGALGPGHWVPGLGQYWSPHVLGGGARGEMRVGGDVVSVDGWRVYAEKNWGSAFPGRWWWGQAHDFSGADDVSVAFAGGELGLGLSATAVVARVGDELVRLSAPLALVRGAADGRSWRISGVGARHRVMLEGVSSSPPYPLPVPIPGERRVEHRAMEELGGCVRVVVRRGRRLVFVGESPLAGLEYGT